MSDRCLYENLICFTAINPIRCTWLPRGLVQTPLDSAALCANKRQSHLTYEPGTSSSSHDINFVFENLLVVIRYTSVCSFNYEPCAVINTLWLCYIEGLASAFDFVFARSRVYWDLFFFRCICLFAHASGVFAAEQLLSLCPPSSVRLYTQNKWRAAEGFFIKFHIGEFILKFC